MKFPFTKHAPAHTPDQWRIGIAFIVTGVFIGLLITTQFRSAIAPSTYPSDALQVQQELVASYLEEQTLLKTKIVNLRSEISTIQDEARSAGQAGLLETLEKLKVEMGLAAARGSGVQIALDDGLFVNRQSADKMAESLIHASDLRDMVNILRSAKVDAIAINDQRIIASTPINSVGNTILVNNFHLLPPFTVTAIGDPELILQRLNDPSALPDLQKRLKDLNIRFAAEVKDGLTAPVYNGNLPLKFLTDADS